MLAKNKRLNLRLLDLQDFFRHSTRINNQYFQAYWRLIETKDHIAGKLIVGKLVADKLKVGVVVSKKVSLLAVKRNFLKRIAYNFFVEEYPNLEKLISVKQNLQLAIFFKKNAADTDKIQLIKELKKIVSQIKDQVS